MYTYIHIYINNQLTHVTNIYISNKKSINHSKKVFEVQFTVRIYLQFASLRETTIKRYRSMMQQHLQVIH